MINPTVTKLRNKVAELEIKLQQKQDSEMLFLGDYNQLRAEIDQMEYIKTELKAKLSQIVQDRDKLSDELLKAKSLNDMLKSELKTAKSTNQTLNIGIRGANRIAQIWQTSSNQNASRIKWWFVIGLLFGTIAGLTLSLFF